MRRYSLRGAWYLIPFSIMWGGFAIVWEATAISARSPTFFVLWGIPFLFVGLYLILGRIPLAMREARQTNYAITNQRLLIVTGALRPRRVETALAGVQSAQLEEGSSGIGTITIGGVSQGWRPPPGWPTMGRSQSFAFESIRDAAQVYRILEEAQASMRAG